MGAIGGDIVSATVNHPEIGTHTFLAKAGETGTYDFGGVRTNDDSNMVDGGGNRIKKMNRVTPFFEMVTSSDLNTNEELDTLTSLAGHPIDGDWTIEHLNGTVHALKGNPVGDIQHDTDAATIKFKVAGGNKMKKIQG